MTHRESLPTSPILSRDFCLAVRGWPRSLGSGDLSARPVHAGDDLRHRRARLDLLVGYGALVSFGHAAFLGIGAYAVGILASARHRRDALIALPVAVAAARAFASRPARSACARSGVYFIMITLAFGQMAFFLASSLAPYGGDDGLTLQARSTLFGLSPFTNERLFYYVVLACLLGCYCLCRALVASRFGRVLRGARENAIRMATLGFEPYRYQLAAYVIAGALGGLAGFLLANAPISSARPTCRGSARAN